LIQDHMSSTERFAKSKELYLSVVDLPTEDQLSALKKLAAGDDLLIEEVVGLLEHTDNRTIIRGRMDLDASAQIDTSKKSTSTTKHHFVSPTITSRVSHWLAGLMLLQLGAMVLTVWNWSRSDLVLRLEIQPLLDSILDGKSKSLLVWLQECRAGTQRVSSNPELVRAVLELEEYQSKQRPSNDELFAHPLQSKIRELMVDYGTSDADLTPDDSIRLKRLYGVLNREGTVISTTQKRDTGIRLNAKAIGDAARVFEGHTVVIPPRPTGTIVQGYAVDTNDPRIFILQPVRDDQGQVRVALAFIFRIDPEFSELLTSRIDDRSIDTYAFNEAGLLLSRIRDEESLHSIGFGSESPEKGVRFQMILRDPGVDLTQHQTLPPDIEQQPLTYAVRAAVSGVPMQPGKPYRDYRGVEVLGASTWISEFGIGLTSELPMHPIKRHSQPWLGMVFAQSALLLGSLAVFALYRRMPRSPTHRSGSGYGEYRVIRELTEGGMGSVLLCEHPRLKTNCVVKVVRSDRNNEENRIRIKREADLGSLLTSPHTVRIWDIGTSDDGRPFLVMDYVQGVTLDSLTDRNPLPPARAVAIWEQVLEAIIEAHTRNILHRDIKPQNIMVGERAGQKDFATLLDFGLVKDMQIVQDDLATSSSGWFGTPSYMPPERIGRPNFLDVRSDIYALGAVLYRMLAGRDPFPSSGDFDLFERIQTQVPQDPREISSFPIEPDLIGLMRDCMAKSPSDRPATCEIVMERLHRLLG
jgi:eukaryotic-like serine/threonine-protein kinase